MPDLEYILKYVRVALKNEWSECKGQRFQMWKTSHYLTMMELV
jgi:hypothetical protein